MNIISHSLNNKIITEVISEDILINSLQDALDLIANISYKNVNMIIIQEHNFTADFYNLKSGLAGEILQKCVNYGIKLAVIGEFEKYRSNSFKAFIIECNRGNQFYFLKNIEEAKQKLAG